jgi:putative pyruvate formate lyase activating enzyme
MPGQFTDITLPSYCNLDNADFSDRIAKACDTLFSCTICPRGCRVNRAADEYGFCRAGDHAVVASFGPHFGEEPPLVGRYGSGTIFFAHCTMACAFCQNYSISQLDEGEQVSDEELAGIMLRLQGMRCHNINLVSPTQFVPQILHAVQIAADDGLRIPLVYNTGGYDAVPTLQLLDGVVDIYMPDAKYGDEEVALALSRAPKYVEHMKAALKEMQRQVGDLVCEDGIAVRGQIIRHLVLPGGLAGTETVVKFIASEISRNAYVNIMPQYRPMWKVCRGDWNPEYAVLRQGITMEEYRQAVEWARKAGLHRGFGGEEGC